MGLSTHYVSTRVKRENFIKSVGLGSVVHTTVQYDPKRDRKFIYEISTTAILTVRAFDEPTLIITRFQARPSRILKYWKNAPQDILEIATKYSQNRQSF